MTGLAPYADLRKFRRKGIRCGIVVFAYRSRVTICTHVVPVLATATPMFRIFDRVCGRIKVIPAILMSYRITRPRPRSIVPNHRQCLQPTAAQIHKVLLQRCYPKRIAYSQLG